MKLSEILSSAVNTYEGTTAFPNSLIYALSREAKRLEDEQAAEELRAERDALLGEVASLKGRMRMKAEIEAERTPTKRATCGHRRKCPEHDHEHVCDGEPNHWTPHSDGQVTWTR